MRTELEGSDKPAMKLDGPDRYYLAVPKGRFSIKAALGDHRFSHRASGRSPKLYVVHDHDHPIYVGVTKQPMADRLRLGWSADGEHGYHGYAWRHAFKSVGLDIWYQTLAASRGQMVDLETVEAEAVYLLRGRYGQWPAYQTEIHFHPSTSSHRKVARYVLELYPKRAAHNNRLKLPARGRSGAESLRRTRAAAYPER